MKTVFSANVQPWAAGEPSVLLSRHGVKVIGRQFTRPGSSTPDDYTYVTGKSGVTVLGITEDGLLVLKREFKQGIGRVLIEAAACVPKEGEYPLDAAERELFEETGHKATRIAMIPGSFVFGPRKYPFGYKLALATGCKLVQPPTPDEGEGAFEVLHVAPNEFWELVAAEEIVSCQTIHAALYVAAIGLIAPPPQ